MAVSHFLLPRKSAPTNLHTNIRFNLCIHAYTLPSEAKHARSCDCKPNITQTEIARNTV